MKVGNLVEYYCDNCGKYIGDSIRGGDPRPESYKGKRVCLECKARLELIDAQRQAAEAQKKYYESH
jgi:DNA-directed RNA polymerase subunit RPC12/RpoP